MGCSTVAQIRAGRQAEGLGLIVQIAVDLPAVVGPAQIEIDEVCGRRMLIVAVVHAVLREGHKAVPHGLPAIVRAPAPAIVERAVDGEFDAIGVRVADIGRRGPNANRRKDEIARVRDDALRVLVKHARTKLDTAVKNAVPADLVIQHGGGLQERSAGGGMERRRHDQQRARLVRLGSCTPRLARRRSVSDPPMRQTRPLLKLGSVSVRLHSALVNG